MAVGALVYLLVGIAFGWAWNRAEFGRAGFRRIAPSFFGFVLAWPGLLACAIVVAAAWSCLWRRAHREDAPVSIVREPAAPMPSFAGAEPRAEPSNLALSR
jgi:hypothetical protein